MKKTNIALMILSSVVFALLLAYLVIVILCGNRFQPNTIINGINYSFKTEESVLNDLDSQMADYGLTVTLRDKSFTIKPNDIDMKITTAKDIQKIKEQQSQFLWFTCVNNEPYTAEFEITYDKDKLKTYLNSIPEFQEQNMIAPKNPTINYINGKIEVEKGTDGTQFNVDNVVSLIEYDLSHLVTELSFEKEGCYRTAKYDINSDKVIEFRDELEDYLNLKITYLYGEKVSFTISPEDIYNMLDIDQDNYTCTVNKEKIANYISKFAEEHDTFGKDRLFKTTSGDLVKVNSDYLGWEIDQENELNELYKNITTKTSIEREPILAHTGHSYSLDNADIGDSYVEFDLTNQKVHFYMNGKHILTDDIISGNPNKYQNTPGGLYEIYSMSYDVMLTGPGYASHVDYWMPFNGEIGMHDAHWQSTFGGDVYLRRGSHGCVNLPYKTAQTIWDMGYRGLPVVCYWRNSNYLVN